MALQKKEILKPLRIALLIAAILAFISLLYSSVNFYRNTYGQPVAIKKPTATYHYQHNAKIDYWVKLKPNAIFKENLLMAGKTYYTKLTDYINLNYSYLFNADQETQLEGSYMITATLEAKDMWHKDFVLLPPQPFSNKAKTYIFNKSYQLRLQPFKDYLKKVNEEIGVTAREPKLTVKVGINLKARAKAGSFSESLVPAMVIPLTEGEYKIEGNLVNKKSNTISKSVTTSDPTLEQKKSRFTLICVATIFAGIFLGYLLFYTNGKPIPPIEEEVLIQKKYGARLLKVPGGIELGDHVMAISFNSFDDLVKIADELGKPIIYFNSPNNELVNYFVFDGQVVYKYLTKREKTPSNIKTALLLQQIAK